MAGILVARNDESGEGRQKRRPVIGSPASFVGTCPERGVAETAAQRRPAM
jgi:hypothetical protein